MFRPVRLAYLALAAIVATSSLAGCGTQTNGDATAHPPIDASDDSLPHTPAPDGGPDAFTGEDAPVDSSGDVDNGDNGDDGAMFSTVLDHFDRADGPLDSAGVMSWISDGDLGTAQYAVAGGELSSGPTTALPIWWNAYYGGSVAVTEVFVTVRQFSPDATSFSLLLVSQTFSPCDFLEVRYEPSTGTLTVASCQLDAFTTYGAPVSVGDVRNRRLGARFETPSGKLSVYVDAVMVAARTIDQWRYLGRPGRIGLWLRRSGASAEGDRFDDFGGR